MPDMPDPSGKDSAAASAAGNSGGKPKSTSSEQPAAKDTMQHYLGFDFGEKRIGVAVGQSATGTANPLCVVRNINGRPEWIDIDSLINEWKPTALVVGWPLTEDGGQQRQSLLAKSFGKHLRRRYALDVHLCDERYSSIEASRIIASNRKDNNRRRASKEDTDKIAAALILEQWLSLHSSNGD